MPKERGKVPEIEAPEGCYCKRKRLKDGSIATYWYYAPDRWKPKAERGKPKSLPAPNTKAWFLELSRLGLEKDAAPARPGTIAELWTLYKKGPNFPKAPSSQRMYESVWKNHIAPVFGDRAVGGPTAAAIVEIRNSYSEQPTTSRSVLAVIAALFNEAVERGMREDNPARQVRRLRLNPDGAKPLTQAAWDALTSPDAPECVRRCAYLGRATGQRISDLVKMMPSMREDDGIRHDIQKTNREAHFSPMEPAWAKVIDGWTGWPNRPYLNVGIKGAFNEAAIRRAWNRFAATDKGEAIQGFTPHDLRATNFCDELLAGYTNAQVAKRRGVDETDVSRYTKHLSGKDIARLPTMRTERDGNKKLRTGRRA